MKNIYFIADAHLSFKVDEREKEKRKKLHDFLEFIMIKGEAKELYLVGDLFDFWFEWYHVIPKYWFPVLYQLRKLVESGITVTFIPGNHDFYPGSYPLKFDFNVILFCKLIKKKTIDVHMLSLSRCQLFRKKSLKM